MSTFGFLQKGTLEVNISLFNYKITEGIAVNKKERLVCSPLKILLLRVTKIINVKWESKDQWLDKYGKTQSHNRKHSKNIKYLWMALDYKLKSKVQVYWGPHSLGQSHAAGFQSTRSPLIFYQGLHNL